MRAKDAGMRCHCKVVLALVQGTTPTMIAQGGLCAKSQVYRVAERFIAEGLAGLVDRREDNGEHKIDGRYLLGLSAQQLCLVGSPGVPLPSGDVEEGLVGRIRLPPFSVVMCWDQHRLDELIQPVEVDVGKDWADHAPNNVANDLVGGLPQKGTD